ncbi:MAG: pyridoxamine 5'-phosphate oxidase family protein [Candidatus Caldarchaeum sp.]|nr:pyridoxamine 5'-phosphate oxidase family protein [Candidatus Caldarchaeum sp.]
MVKLSPAEQKFIESNELCRLATADEKGTPHVVPVAYIFSDNKFYIATDYGTKKLSNIKKNNKVSLVVDRYKPNKAVMVVGEAYILEKGPEFREMYRQFYEKFAWVRKNPWNEGEAPFIVVKPLKVVSWGL